jgi:CHAT domain-containing protein
VNRIRAATTDAEYLQASGALHDLLIGHIADDLTGAKRLIFVPNKEFADVSFSALYDRRARTFLIERAQSIVAPSASSYAFASQRDRNLQSAAATAFVAGHPGGGTLEELPEVDAEVRSVAAVYPGAERVVSMSDKGEFLERSSRATIVHFAGHGVGNDSFPEFASLAVGARSPLYAYEIARSSFVRTRVVVLSSCGARAGGRTNESVLGVPYAFLAAGVPVVVAATDEVPDTDAEAMIVRFHAALARSGHPGEAFQSMQVEMIRNGVSPRHWGVWQFLGGPNS